MLTQIIRYIFVVFFFLNLYQKYQKRGCELKLEMTTLSHFLSKDMLWGYLILYPIITSFGPFEISNVWKYYGKKEHLMIWFQTRRFLKFSSRKSILDYVTKICNGPEPFEQLLKRAI